MRSTAGRLVRAAGAALLLLVMLAVLPTALVVVQSAVVWDWRVILAQPMSELGAAAAAVGVGWLVWLTLVWQVMLDAVAVLRGRRRAAAWLPVPLRTAVTAAASGVLLALHTARGGAPALAAAELMPGPAAAQDAHASPVDRAAGPSSAVRRTAGVDVPGGWLSLPIAAAVAVAARLALTHTRRGYVPRPPGGWHRHDRDLPPWPPAVQRLAQAGRMATEVQGPDLADLDTADTMDLGTDLGTEHDVADFGVVGRRDTRPSVALREIMPDGDLSLTGPGRYRAARGLIVALAVQPHEPPRILLRTGLAGQVLGTAQVPTTTRLLIAGTGVGHDPGSDVVVFTNDRDEADPASPPPASALRPADAGHPPDGDVGQTTHRTVRVTATPDGGTCWHVNDDGTVHAVTGQRPAVDRLPVLHQQITTELLTSLGLLADTAESMPAGHASPAGSEAANDPTRWPDPPPDTAGVPRRLLVRVFGEVGVLRPHPDGSRSPVPIRRTAGQQMLVLLTLHRDGLTGDELKEALWPDVPSSAAHRRYLTTLSELRRTLRDAAGRPVLRQDPPAGAANGEGQRVLRLDPAAVQVDLWRLQGLLDAAANTTDAGYRHVLLAAAAEIAGGELAAGWAYEWLLVDRERTIRHLLDVYTYLADAASDPQAALRLLHQGLRLAPTNEQLHRRVLQHHAAAGDPDGLRRAADTLTEHLTAHGYQPDPATIALLTSLLTDPIRPDSQPQPSDGQFFR
ncbi:AfsR/SARP family transcriptional regulator [Dactylosporangium sp. CS-047395]|uniref:AfsR/SARP family transcriptional regulator n=1 Tax=Dactylosporangium sp. CS-047395 TaxID=3239936 RepID=UPI003D8D7DE6